MGVLEGAVEGIGGGEKGGWFVPICRNFDKSTPLQDTLDFNHKVFEEDRSIVEHQHPEHLPIELNEEVHIRADLASITYRKMLGEMGLSRSFTA